MYGLAPFSGEEQEIIISRFEHLVYTDSPETTTDNSATLLHQNQPNPFSSTTTIPFCLEHSKHVELCVFNIHGQRVKTLLNEEVSSGVNRADWDGCNESGLKLDKGLYFYRLKTNKQVLTRSLILN
jgi:flagellar hook assembly protein FlgD